MSALLSDHDVKIVDVTALDACTLRAWDDIVAGNDGLWSPFFDHRFARLMARHGQDAAFILVSNKDGLQAILPFQGQLSGTLRALGGPLADIAALICRPNCPFSIDDVLAHIEAKSFWFGGLWDNSPKALLERRALGQQYYATMVAQVDHIVDLSGGFEAYDKARRSLHKDYFAKIARRIKRGEEEFGPMRVEHGVRCLGLLDRLLTQKSAQYRHTGRHDITNVGWIKRFLTDLVAVGDSRFGGEMSILYFGDQIAAMELGMVSRHALHSWFPVFDQKFAAIAPGTILMDAVITNAPNRGITKIDLGVGHGDYKKYVANQMPEVLCGRMALSASHQRVARLRQRVKRAIGGMFGQSAGRLAEKISRRLDLIVAAEPKLLGKIGGVIQAMRR